MTRFGLASLVALVVWLGWAKHAEAEATVWSQVAQLENGSSTFGLAVSISNNTILVGDYTVGKAYLWERTGASQWSKREPLPAPHSYGFGTSVSLSGDTAIVGAPIGVGPTVGPGWAFVFVRGADVWPLQGDLTANDGTAPDSFGASVAISGDTVVVGAPQKAIGSNIGQGAAYVFVRSSGGWEQQGPALIAPDGGESDSFGSAVSIFDDTVVIGAPGLRSSAGRAYVFSRTGTTWTQQGAALVPPDTTSEGNFGVAASASADTVLIGADGAYPQRGAAYLFTRDGSDWATHRLALESSAPVEGDHFGNAVALLGDVALISAPGTLQAVYVFTRLGASWTQQGPRFLIDGSLDHTRGGVALSDEFAVVGAQGIETVPYSPRLSVYGTAYVFAPRTDATFCEQDTDCPEQLYCAVIGICEPRLQPGRTCTHCNEPDCRVCAIGSCVDGTCLGIDNGLHCTAPSDCRSLVCLASMCCEDYCDGNCRSCAEPGMEGHCVTIQGQPREGHGVCADGKGCIGYCDGQSDSCNLSTCTSNGASGAAGSGEDGESGAAGGSGEEGGAAGTGSEPIAGSADSGGSCSSRTECATPESSSSACGCHLPRRSASSTSLLLTLLTIGAVLRRKRSTESD